MARFHSRRAIHRDLKPAHVFLDDRFEPVLGGLCMAKIVADPLKMTISVGTQLYMAPELFIGDEPYDNSIDVYAFAVLMYHLFAPRETRIRNGPQFAASIAKGERFPRLPNIPDSFWCLIEVCWQQDRTKRPTFAEIVDRLKTSLDLVFPGTDMREYRNYQERLGSEQLADPRPIELVDALYSIVGWPPDEDDAT
jgi:serine/threonine protein kinase